MDKSMEKYILKIWTNERYHDSGTNSRVEVKITGENGHETKWTKLNYLLENDFEPGSKREYSLEHAVGAPSNLAFRLVGISSRKNWMLKRVTVKYRGEKHYFPVYRWVENDVVWVAHGKAQLPQSIKHEYVKVQRAEEIRQNKSKLLWNEKPAHPTNIGWGINRYLHTPKGKDLPLVYSKTRGQKKNFESGTLEGALSVGMSLFKSGGVINNLDDYKELYKGADFKDPPFIEDWKRDEEFGRQVLTGISPLAFERCKELPKDCNINQNHVDNLLESGKTLHSEMQEGKLYIANYSFVANIKKNRIPLKARTFDCSSCIGLFYATLGEFVPIAIQLIPGDAESVFTPTDEPYDWLLAKLYFRVTSASVHQWLFHFLHTHGLSETFSVATFRCFPHCHPVFKLLKPHLTSVIAINKSAREALLPPGSLANQAIALSALETTRYCFKSFDLSQMDVPHNLEVRGVDDAKLLPNYHYRDDSLEVWGAVKSYVTNVIDYFYKSDKDIQDDFELQGWSYELAHDGFGWQDGNTRGMPDKINTRDELVRICTIIIFVSTAQHAAVNFGQMETHQFVPNAPTCMRLPSHKKGEGSEKRIIDSLPGSIIGSVAIAITYALSIYPKDETFLGDFSEKVFIETEIIQIQKDFKAALIQLSRKFNARNNSIKYPYWYLLPEKIPADINI